MTEKISPPLSLLAGAAGIEAGNDSALQAAKSSLADAAAAAQTLADALTATTADPSMSPSQRTLKSARLSEQLGESIARRLDSARSAIASQVAAIEGLPTWNPPKSMTASGIAIERDTAAVLRGMSVEERMQAINTAIRENDSTVLAALSSGPSFLTGTKADARAALVDDWRKRHSPNHARHLALQTAQRRVDAAGQATIAWIAQLAADSGLSALVEKAAEARAKAEAAAKAA